MFFMLGGNLTHTDHSGVAMMSTSECITLMEEMVAQGGDLAIHPLAILVPYTDKEALDQLEAPPIVHKFRPQHLLELLINVGEYQDTRRPNAIMYLLGHEAISYNNPIPTHDFGDQYLVQQVSAQIYDDDVQKELCIKLRKDPHSYITTAFGAAKLDKTRTAIRTQNSVAILAQAILAQAMLVRVTQLLLGYSSLTRVVDRVGSL